LLFDGMRTGCLMNLFAANWRWVGAFLWGLAIGVTAQEPVEITLEASRDNTIFTEGDLSNGEGSHLFAGRTLRGEQRRALLAFDLDGVVPAGATIESATLELQMNKTIAGAATFSVHRLLADWGEGSSDAALEEGMGIAAQPGDATWNHRSFSSLLWNTVGGDFTASSSASTSVAGVGNYSWSGVGLVADVQAWVDAPAENFGWILLGPGTPDFSAKRFDSRHASNASVRPRLTIRYRAAAPGYRDAWITQYFGSGATVEFGTDLDEDGLSQLEEYAFGFDPIEPNTNRGRRVQLPANSTERTKVIFRRDPRAADVVFRVEASGDLLNWEAIAESVDGAPTSGEATISEEPLEGADGVLRVTVTDASGPPSPDRRFFRLLILDTSDD
jgi:hypothetical protein